MSLSGGGDVGQQGWPGGFYLEDPRYGERRQNPFVALWFWLRGVFQGVARPATGVVSGQPSPFGYGWEQGLGSIPRPRRDDFLGQMIIPARGRFSGNYILPGTEIPTLELRTAGMGGLGDAFGTGAGVLLFAGIAGGLLYLWATRKAGSGRLIRNPKLSRARAFADGAYFEKRGAGRRLARGMGWSKGKRRARSGKVSKRALELTTPMHFEKRESGRARQVRLAMSRKRYRRAR